MILSQKGKERYNNKHIKEEILKKRKKTNLIKYGVEHTSQLEYVKNKIKQTVLSKLGVSSGTKIKHVKGI